MERKFGWIKDKHDHRDMQWGDVIVPQDLPARVDLSEIYKVPVVDQGSLGSCTGNGIAGALAYLELKEGRSLDYPSRLFIYYNERVLEGTINEDAGAEIRDGIKSVVTQGFCSETDWPYDTARFADQPSAQAYDDASKDLVNLYQRVTVRAESICQAIAAGFPVIFGITVYESFTNSTDGNIPMPSPSEREEGGHCMIAVGYDQTTRMFKFQNSWGTGWGDNGFGEIPFDYLGSPTFGGDYWIVQADQVTPPNPIPPTRSGCRK